MSPFFSRTQVAAMESDVVQGPEPQLRRRPRWRLRFLFAVQALALAMFVISRLEPQRARSLGPAVEYLYVLFNPLLDREINNRSWQFQDQIRAMGGTAHFVEYSPGFLGVYDRGERYGVRLVGSTIGDDDLAWLAGRHGTRVVALSLVETNVSDKGLGYLKEFAHLQQLDLLNAMPASIPPPRGSITDAGLVQLNLPNLTSLRLSDLPITDQGLQALADLADLQSLELRGTKIQGRGLRALNSLPALKMLTLDDSAITDEGLSHLAGASNLESLTLDGCPITAAGLKQLVPLRQLRYLSVRRCGLQAEDLKVIKINMPNVTIHE